MNVFIILITVIIAVGVVFLDDPFIIAFIAVIAFQIYCYMAVHSLYHNMKEKSLLGLNVSNVQTANSSMPISIDVPEELHSEPNDYNYMKLG